MSFESEQQLSKAQIFLNTLPKNLDGVCDVTAWEKKIIEEIDGKGFSTSEVSQVEQRISQLVYQHNQSLNPGITGGVN